MAFDSSRFTGWPNIIGPVLQSATVNQHTIGGGTAFVFGVSGPCWGIKFCAHFTDTITDVYGFTTAGSFANCCIREADPTTGLPSTKIGNEVEGACGTNVWARFTGLAAPVTAGKIYWLFVNGTADILEDATFSYNSILADPQANLYSDWQPYVASTGGGSSMTLVSNLHTGLAVVKYQTNGVVGNPYRTTANDSSNTRERGIIIQGLTNDITVAGVINNTLGTRPNTLKIREGSTGTSDPTILSLTYPTGGSAEASPSIAATRFSPVTLEAGKTYVVSFGYGSNDNGPGTFDIGDYSTFADVKAAAYGGLECFGHAIDNGSGVWTKSWDKMARMSLIIAPSHLVAPDIVVPGRTGRMIRRGCFYGG